jgi:hypothetical protein
MVNKLTWRQGPLFNLLQYPQGVVGRDLLRRARRVETAAKAQVGVKSGRLRNSIKIDNRVPTPTGQRLTVGSDVKYALIHHNGSRPHVILPVTARQLVFVAGGRVVRTNRVNHPGTKPNRFLTDNLPLAIIDP